MTEEAEIQTRRIHVGGLFHTITASELTDKFSKFGDVVKVELKVRKNECGTPNKTFAYVDFLSTKANWNRCLSTFNRTKWKGFELKLALAKSSFLDKLDEERRAEKNPPQENLQNSHLHNPLQLLPNSQCFELRGAVPGTPIPGEKDWIVGKYGRILPILHLKKDGKQKLVTTDPSKYCHNVKRLKDDDGKNNSATNLTWEITHSDSAVTRKRKGKFESWTPRLKKHTDQNYFVLKKFYDKKLERSRNGMGEDSESDEFEVVKSSNRISDGDESAGSADTDEIIAHVKSSGKQSHGVMNSRKLASNEYNDDSVITNNKSNRLSTHNSVVKMPDSLSLRCKSDTSSSKLCLQNSINKESKAFFRHIYNSDSSCSNSSSDSVDSADTSPGKDVTNSILKRKPANSLSKNHAHGLKSPAIKQAKYSKTSHIENDLSPTSSSCLSNSDSNEVISASKTPTSPNWNARRVPEFKGLSFLSSDSEDSSDDSTANKFKGEKIIDGNSLKRVNGKIGQDSNVSDSDSASSSETDEICSSDKKNINNATSLSKCLKTKLETSLNPNDEFAAGFSIIGGDVSYIQRKTITDECDDDFVNLVKSTDMKIMSSTPKPAGLSLDESDVSSSSDSSDDTYDGQEIISGSSLRETPTPMSTTAKQLSKSAANISTLSPEADSKMLKDSDLNREKTKSIKQKTSKKLEKKHVDDNEKRLLSVKNRQKDNEMLKAILKKALSDVDGASSCNKKTVFDSDDDDDDDSDPLSTAEPSVANSHTGHSDKRQMANTGPILFDSEDDNDENDDDADTDMFRLREQYEGKSGKKLMSLQSRIGTDERFRLDARFADVEEDDNNEQENAGESEKERSLKILESVVGHAKIVKLHKQEWKKKPFRDISAIRFDPTREDHSQFEIKRSPAELSKQPKKPEKSKKKVKKGDNDDVAEEELPVVDKMRHYEVSATLKDAFKKSESQSKESFSLLSAFGTQKSELESSDEEDTSVKASLTQLPWKAENNSDEELMSDSDADDDGPDSFDTNTNSTVPRVIFPVKKFTFFFQADDERLKEGVKYFQRPSDYENVVKTWRQTRPDLIDAFKLKHKRALKRLQSKQKPLRR